VATVAFTDPALDDLRRAGPRAAPRLLERCSALVNGPLMGEPLVDATVPFRALDLGAGAGRIVYDTDGDAVTIREIWVDGARSDGEAYAEALQRMQGADPSEQVALARILQRLARITGTRPVTRGREPVPDWLAEVLLATGRAPLELATMDARSAFAAWNADR
jgi:mRNA interferase RelE/StbE